MASRRNPRAAGTVGAGSTPASTPPRPSIEERRRLILEGLEKLDDAGMRRVEWFVRGILENDRVLLSLASARVVDEPLTEEDLKALAESDAEMERGEYLTHEEVRRLWLGDRA